MTEMIITIPQTDPMVIAFGKKFIASLQNSGGIVTSFEGTKQYNSLEEAAELKNCAAIGALLSYNEDTGIYTAWNGTDELHMKEDTYGWGHVVEYLDTNDQSSLVGVNPMLRQVLLEHEGNMLGRKQAILDVMMSNEEMAQYGTIIGVCVGKGLWIDPWFDNISTSMWAQSGSNLYNTNHTITCHADGYTNTQHILSEIGNGNIEETLLWKNVMKFREDNPKHGKVYIPSKLELLDIQTNLCTEHKNDKGDVNSAGDHWCNYASNIGLYCWLAPNWFWSSSQYPNFFYYAYGVDFGSGCVEGSFKTTNNQTLALLHFGA